MPGLVAVGTGRCTVCCVLSGLWLRLTMRLLYAVCVGLVLAAVLLPGLSRAAIAGGFLSSDPATQRLVDDAGRERYFHGVNVVYKAPPYVPITDHFDLQYSFAEQDAALLESLGLNVIRLGVMWPGVEPQRAAFNDTYLDIIAGIVDMSAKHGIYSLLDMHQDVLSEKFCGEGAPAWAVEPGAVPGFPEPLARPFPINPATGLPFPEDCAKFQWPQYFETMAVNAAYQAFYSNRDGIANSWAMFWLKVAMRFKGAEAVLGYELINEPWAGDVFADPSLIIPTVADRKNLQPLYDMVSGVVRAVDAQHPLLFAGVTWDDTGVGFDHVPGGDGYRNKSVLAYHFYIPPQIELQTTMRIRAADMARLGCGGMMTEFNCGSVPEMEAADQFLQSWIGWEYKRFVPLTGFSDCLWLSNGTVNAVNARALARTYARAVAGRTQLMQFSPATGVFTLVYRMDPQIALPTEIFASSQWYYLSGWEVDVEPATAATVKQVAADVLEVHATAAATAQTVLTVTIRPRSPSNCPWC